GVPPPGTDRAGAARAGPDARGGEADGCLRRSVRPVGQAGRGAVPARQADQGPVEGALEEGDRAMNVHLERLARRVLRGPLFLAAPLTRFAESHRLDDEGLAARLGCDRDTLTHLRLCRNPDP